MHFVLVVKIIELVVENNVALNASRVFVASRLLNFHLQVGDFAVRVKLFDVGS